MDLQLSQIIKNIEEIAYSDFLVGRMSHIIIRYICIQYTLCSSPTVWWTNGTPPIEK